MPSSPIMARLLALGFFVAGFQLACSDDEGAGPAGTFDSGIRGNRRILELDAMEALTFCQRRAEFVRKVMTIEERRELACIGTSLLVGASEMACMESYDGCLANPPSFPEDTCAFNSATDRDSCNATVDEVEACQNAISRLQRRHLAELSCADVGNQAVLDEVQGSPPECESIRDICQSGVRGGGGSAG